MFLHTNLKHSVDLSKAFDTVPHLRLIEKMKAYSVGGKFL